MTTICTNSFLPFGQVQSAKVMMERDTGRSKGFGFVEMSSGSGSRSGDPGNAWQNMGGRDLTVNIARPMEARLPVVVVTAVATVMPVATALIFDRSSRGQRKLAFHGGC